MYFAVSLLLASLWGALSLQHFGPGAMQGVWRDGDGQQRFGEPIGPWKDGNGMTKFDIPKPGELWSEGKAKATDMISSRSNAWQASQAYPNSPVEKFVATALGDEMQPMRDDLIRRKNNGEGFVERHMNAWGNKENWKFDPIQQERNIINEQINADLYNRK